MADVNARFQWLSSSGGLIPSNAIPGGYARSGEPLYIGRVSHKGHMICGKIHPSHKALYVPHAGKEHAYHSGYEILVRN